MNNKPKFWDRLSPNQKLQYALRHGKEPVRYDGEDVEAARKQEEARDTSTGRASEWEMARDAKEHKVITGHKESTKVAKHRNERRKGLRRNNVERVTLARLGYDRFPIMDN